MRKDVLRDYLRRYRPYRWSLVLSAIQSVLQSLLLVVLALLIKLAFDRILTKAGFSRLVLPCGAILLVATASVILALLARHHALRITKLVVQDIRLELLAGSYRRSAFSGTAARSAEHSAIVQDTERVDVASNAVIAVAMPALITSSIFLAALMALAPMLLLAALCAAPLAVLSHRQLGGRLQGLVEQFRLSFQTFDESILAALHRLDLTQLRGAEDFEIARHAETVDHLRRTSGQMAWTATAYSLGQGWIVSVVSVITLLAGGTAVAQGTITLSGLAAYYFVLVQLGSSLNALWTSAPQILAGLDSLGNIARLQGAPSAMPSGGSRRHAIRGGVVFDKVQFSYGPEPLLQQIDLCLAPGERIVIMGPNGSGKSTLAHLLLGMHAPLGGNISIDGIPLSELVMPDYRRQIGIVLQDSLLFDGTVFQNIVYGHEGATVEDVERAAILAHADGFVRAMGGGYQAPVDGLSGGQSQMLGLARALVGRPRLLVLDEPTNHLDDATVRALFEGLDAAEYRPSIVLITHDSALASRFGRCFVLQDGRLVRAARA